MMVSVTTPAIQTANTTMNSGRIQINLKPLDDRSAKASDIIRRLQSKLSAVEGITLYMQPVQDLTVEDRNRLNGGVERIIQKTDRDETLREVCGALTKLLKRGRGEKTVGA